ncbi:phage head completion protein [Companilactobacillus zhongbaensis]|uniref:phage head completion protein n=1 Tax=Companilactobacillus zhongbaensis TaxID=2486009 RepID=UPI000F7B80A7|nr:head-tail adaptor protein [Companilactobacillus zhongbaensis]
MKQLVSDPSELNEVIKFYSEEPYITDDGVMVDSERILFTTWTKVLSDLLKDYKIDAGNMMSGKTSFVIRHDQPKKIDTSMGIYWKNDKYTIENILKDNSYKQYDTVVCSLKS